MRVRVRLCADVVRNNSQEEKKSQPKAREKEEKNKCKLTITNEFVFNAVLNVLFSCSSSFCSVRSFVLNPKRFD